eukprot:SAG31_NODE_4353_length_3321_cov_2.678150_1_plen_56_part_10
MLLGGEPRIAAVAADRSEFTRHRAGLSPPALGGASCWRARLPAASSSSSSRRRRIV